VSQVIAHAGNLLPGDAGLCRQQVGGQCLDCIAYLQQPHPDGIEDQAVSQSPAF
jgi:hypothetical protein